MTATTKRYILLVEDNPTDEKLALRAIKRAGRPMPLVIVRDGVEALEHLHGRDGEPSPTHLPALVLLDLKLPRVDGREVLRRIRADARTCFQPVVVLTTSREESDLNACYQLGVNAYVCKPLEFEAFAEAMQTIAGFWLGLNEPAGGWAP